MMDDMVATLAKAITLAAWAVAPAVIPDDSMFRIMGYKATITALQMMLNEKGKKKL